MAVTSKDIEILWGRYQSEGVGKGMSVSQYFEANGIPYHVFEKWYKKRYRHPDVVECKVEDDLSQTPTSLDQQSDPIVPVSQGGSLMVTHITICLNNGLRIDHHKLGFSELVSFIKKLEPLCFA